MCIHLISHCLCFSAIEQHIQIGETDITLLLLIALKARAVEIMCML